MTERLFPFDDLDAGLDALRRSVLSVNWELSPAGPIGSWPLEIRSTVRTALRASSPMAVLIGREGIVVRNAAALEMFGDAFDASQGKPIFDVLPVAREFYRKAIDDSFRGISARYRDQPIKLVRGGVEQTCWFNLGLSPIANDVGHTFGTLLMASETTAHMRTRKALKLAHERIETALEAGGIVGTWDFDVATRTIKIDGRLAQRFGVGKAEASTGVHVDTLIENVHSEDRKRVLSSMNDAISAGARFRSRFRANTKDGDIRWFVAFGRPVRDAQDDVSALAGIVLDTTSETEAISALEYSNLRFETLVEAIPQIVWSTDADGNHDFFNRRWTEFTGIGPNEITPTLWTKLVHPDDWSRLQKAWSKSLATGQTYDIDYRFRFRDGSYRWVRVIAMPMRDGQGNILRWYGTSTDIEEAKQLEFEKELVTRELDHRIKNLFAVVHGLVGLSAREDPAIAPAADQLRSRIMALQRAHDMVRRNADAESIPLKELLTKLLLPYQTAQSETFVITGDEVLVAAGVSTSIALIFHELATNAAKYGALRNAGGRLTVTLKKKSDWLDILWSERFTNDCADRGYASGFGSRLMEGVVVRQLRGQLSSRRSEGGVTIRIRLPNSHFGEVTNSR